MRLWACLDQSTASRLAVSFLALPSCYFLLICCVLTAEIVKYVNLHMSNRRIRHA